MKQTYRYIVGDLPKDIDYINASKKELSEIESAFSVKVVEVQLAKDRYVKGDNLAVLLMTRPDKDECEYFGLTKTEAAKFSSEYTEVTVNTFESNSLERDTQFVDENNNPGIGDWLVRNGIAQKTNHTCQSGFCKYTAYKFNLDKLQDETVQNP